MGNDHLIRREKRWFMMGNVFLTFAGSYPKFHGDWVVMVNNSDIFHQWSLMRQLHGWDH